MHQLKQIVNTGPTDRVRVTDGGINHFIYQFVSQSDQKFAKGYVKEWFLPSQMTIFNIWTIFNISLNCAIMQIHHTLKRTTCCCWCEAPCPAPPVDCDAFILAFCSVFLGWVVDWFVDWLLEEGSLVCDWFALSFCVWFRISLSCFDWWLLLLPPNDCWMSFVVCCLALVSPEVAAPPGAADDDVVVFACLCCALVVFLVALLWDLLAGISGGSLLPFDAPLPILIQFHVTKPDLHAIYRNLVKYWF